MLGGMPRLPAGTGANHMTTHDEKICGLSVGIWSSSDNLRGSVV